MTTLAEVLTAGYDLLAPLAGGGLNRYARVPDSPEFPAIFWNPVPDADYWDSAEDDWIFTLNLILVASGAFDEHQQLLVPYLERTGPKSIFALFQANRSLGLPDVDAVPRGVRPLNQVEVAGYRGYGAAIPVNISIAGA